MTDNEAMNPDPSASSDSCGADDGVGSPTPTVSTGASSVEDFATLLAEQERSGIGALRLSVGDRVKAKVVHMGQESAFCELSATQEAVIPITDLADERGRLAVAVGDTLDAFVVSLRDGITLSKKLGRDAVDVQMLQSAREQGIPVEGTVTGVNKGGLEVSIGGARGFCPISQVDIDYVEDATVLVGKSFDFLVREVRDNGRTVVLSRRALLEAEKKERAAVLLESLEVGARLTGTVTRLTDFGAFVDLGGIDGLIPMRELSFARVESAQDVLSAGDEVTVEVLRIEDDPKRPGTPRIGLSLKAALPDPFVMHADAIVEGAVVTGTVVRIEAYGAFVELFPGVQGLVHVSQLSYRRVRHPNDVVTVGDSVTARVVSVDPPQRRVGLSLRDVGETDADEGPGDDDRASAGAVRRAPHAARAVGDAVEGTVERVERYGVFVALQGGGTALLPTGETGTPPGTDLARAFPLGTSLNLQITQVDEQGRLRASKRARDAADERTLVDSYNRVQGSPGKGFGTFGDLLKNRLK